jgi:glucokinase
MTVIAVDVGGTAMKGAVVSAEGVARAVERRPTGAERGPEAVVAALLDFAAGLRDRAGGQASAAGIAVPGLVDEVSGTALYAANLGWREVPLRRLAAERLGLPVVIAHDVRAGGLAEAELGAGRGRDFLFVPVGTGIAAALVIGGRPYPGGAGDSGELGHLTVRPGGEPCACGRRGCLEAYASAAALARRGGAPPREVIARAAAGDARADAVWGEALDALAEALASATLLLDPHLIVLGGGLAESGDALLAPRGRRRPRRPDRTARRRAAGPPGGVAPRPTDPVRQSGC